MHPKIKVQRRTFESLKPHFVRRLKDQYTMCCIYHVQMGFLKDSLNLLRHHNSSLQDAICTCTCPICRSTQTEVCKSSEHVCVSMSGLLDLVLGTSENITLRTSIGLSAVLCIADSLNTTSELRTICLCSGSQSRPPISPSGPYPRKTQISLILV